MCTVESRGSCLWGVNSLMPMAYMEPSDGFHYPTEECKQETTQGSYQKLLPSRWWGVCCNPPQHMNRTHEPSVLCTQAWVEQQKKKPGASGGGGSGSRGVSKTSARPGGNSIGTGRRGLGASTASTRNASRGAAGGRRGVLGKGKGRAEGGPGGWGEEEESALEGLAEKLGVVRKHLKLKSFVRFSHSLLLFMLFFSYVVLVVLLFPPCENLGVKKLKQEKLRKTTD